MAVFFWERKGFTLLDVRVAQVRRVRRVHGRKLTTVIIVVARPVELMNRAKPNR